MLQAQVLHGHPYYRVVRCWSPPAVVHCRGGIEVSYDDAGAYHGQLSVGLHEVLEERVRGFAERDMQLDDVELAGCLQCLGVVGRGCESRACGA